MEKMYDHVESLFMLVSRRVHLIVSVSILGGITSACDLWERANAGRLSDTMLTVTDSFDRN